MNISRLFKPRDGLRSVKPAFPLPHLTSLLAQNGFTYLGFFPEPDHMRGRENHFFSKDDVTFLFGFAYGLYGEDLIAIGDTDKPETFVYLSYYVDYAVARNDYRNAGMSHDEALAVTLREHIDSVVALYRYVRERGRSIPLKADRESISGVSPNKSFKPNPLRGSA